MNGPTKVRKELDQLVARRLVPGIQYSVVDQNGVRFEYQAGFSDLSLAKPVAIDTTFMASSSTKVITAAAILQLAEQSAVAVDRPLSAYYPTHPYGDKVTIRHLLAQTSGIPNPLPLKWLHLATEHNTFKEELALQQTMNRHPRLRSKPGERYAYSNISYWLLGRVVEAASGQRFAQYVEHAIFDRLGIPPAEASFQIQEQQAVGFQRLLTIQGLLLYLLMDRRMTGRTVRGELEVLPVYMNGPAYGGLTCTASGFAKFLQDMLQPTPRLFSSRTRDLLFTPQTTSNGDPTGMTLGWRVGSLQGESYFSKPGGGPGFRSNVRIYPRLSIGVAWVANETGASEGQMSAISDAVDRHWFHAQG